MSPDTSIAHTIETLMGILGEEEAELTFYLDEPSTYNASKAMQIIEKYILSKVLWILGGCVLIAILGYDFLWYREMVSSFTYKLTEGRVLTFINVHILPVALIMLGLSQYYVRHAKKIRERFEAAKESAEISRAAHIRSRIVQEQLDVTAVRIHYLQLQQVLIPLVLQHAQLDTIFSVLPASADTSMH